MFRFIKSREFVSSMICSFLAVGIISAAVSNAYGQQDLNGFELLSMTRVAQGGEAYSSIQRIKTRSRGFVNVAPIIGVGLGTGPAASMVEIKLEMTDWQIDNARRRLQVVPTGPATGITYLLYSGSSGGGMYMGNEFRVSEVAASRHWGLMGFSTLNQAVDREFKTIRLRDESMNYVVEVKFNATDSLRYFITKKTFLINKVVTYYNGKMLVEEDRSDYRRKNCVLLPYRIVTRLVGQRVSDLEIEDYEINPDLPGDLFN